MLLWAPLTWKTNDYWLPSSEHWRRLPEALNYPRPLPTLSLPTYTRAHSFKQHKYSWHQTHAASKAVDSSHLASFVKEPNTPAHAHVFRVDTQRWGMGGGQRRVKRWGLAGSDGALSVCLTLFFFHSSSSIVAWGSSALPLPARGERLSSLICVICVCVCVCTGLCVNKLERRCAIVHFCVFLYLFLFGYVCVCVWMPVCMCHLCFLSAAWNHRATLARSDWTDKSRLGGSAAVRVSEVLVDLQWWTSHFYL